MGPDLIFFISILLVRPLMTLVHELGHGIPALLLTKDRTSIYVGSLGENKGSLRIKLGLLELFLRYNIFKWNKGVCIPHSKEVSINRKIIYILMGPLTPAIVSAIILAFVFRPHHNSYLQFFAIMLLLASIYEAIINLKPRERPVVLANGKITYNDGKLIQQFFMLKRIGPSYTEAAEFYNNKNYAEAEKHFLKILEDGNRDVHIFKLAVTSGLMNGASENVLKLFTEFHATGKMDMDDLNNAGMIFAANGLLDDADRYLEQALRKNSNHLHATANSAYVQLQRGNYNAAIELFDATLTINGQFAYAYSNRGLAKIKMGDEAGGLEDIHTGMNMDPAESYGPRNMGIYHILKGERSTALEYLEKARALNEHTHQLDHYFQIAEELKS